MQFIIGHCSAHYMQFIRGHCVTGNGRGVVKICSKHYMQFIIGHCSAYYMQFIRGHCVTGNGRGVVKICSKHYMRSLRTKPLAAGTLGAVLEVAAHEDAHALDQVGRLQAAGCQALSVQVVLCARA